jgi:K+/H+ antiporter YhaU regulatory subunit KhtT
MDQRALLGVMVVIRRALNEFAQNSDDPIQSLANLSSEIERLFSAVTAHLSDEDQEIATELQEILMDQIALMRRSPLALDKSIRLPGSV